MYEASKRTLCEKRTWRDEDEAGCFLDRCVLDADEGAVRWNEREVVAVA